MRRIKASVVLLTYNQSRFIRDSLRSLLAQDMEDLEIFISDDCSTDETFAVIEQEVKAYQGPHRVTVNRNARNMGGDHLDHAARRAQGTYLVIAHGDDIARPNRVRRLVETLEREQVSLVSTNADVIDERSEPLGTFEAPGASGMIDIETIIASWNRKFLGATTGCHRDVFTKFAPLTTLRLGEAGDDYVLPFRAHLLSGAYYLNECLIRYRRHAGNLGDRLVDRTSTPQIADEGFAAHRLMGEVCLLDDLDFFEQEAGATPETRDIRQRLLSQITHTAREWIRRRNELISSGYRATWVRRDQLDRRPLNDDLLLHSHDLDEMIALVNKGELEAARRIITQAEQAGTHVAPFHYHASRILARSGRVDEALIHAREAIRLDGHSAHYRAHLSRLHARRGEADQALALIREAIDLAPENGDFHHRLSRLLAEMGQTAQAISALQAALSCDPDNLAYHKLMTHLLSQRLAQLRKTSGSSAKSPSN